MKSRAGIRSTYSPCLIGWLSRRPNTLRISSAHNEMCPAALTLGFNQIVAHCLKHKGSPTKSVTEPASWPQRRCVVLQYLQLWICPFCCSQYSLQLQSILFYESDKKMRQVGKNFNPFVIYRNILENCPAQEITSRSHRSPPTSMPPPTSWLRSPWDTKTPPPTAELLLPHPSERSNGSITSKESQSSVHLPSLHMLIYLFTYLFPVA